MNKNTALTLIPKHFVFLKRVRPSPSGPQGRPLALPAFLVGRKTDPGDLELSLVTEKGGHSRIDFQGLLCESGEREVWRY